MTTTYQVPYMTFDQDPDEAGLYQQGRQALDRQKWSEARELFRLLATRAPANSRYRALLAYARGQEWLDGGDEVRARDEWRRALILDPRLEDARRMLAVRSRPRSWVDRLLGRA
jgi:Flp pilus assembly protein TadD